MEGFGVGTFGLHLDILTGLAEVIHGDERISHFETDYFDMVGVALKASPSEIAGLVPDRPITPS